MTDTLNQSVQLLSEYLMSKQGWLATAESCTGGLVAAAATSLAGSSNWFDQGWVTYSNEAKQKELGVSLSSLEQFGAVSEEVASQMATGILSNAPRATLAIATTGIAGPGGATPTKPVGLVWFGFARRSSTSVIDVRTISRVFVGDRQAVRNAAVRFAFETALEFAAA